MKGLSKLVLASGNPGKLREIRELLATLGTEVVAQGELGIDEAEEPHATFLENALAKARHASRAAGLPALADDSGLCVNALGGAPGAYSAHFAGRHGNREARDARNNAKLLDALVSSADRRAHFCCVLVLCRSADDPRPVFAEGTWQGEILERPRGANGFGYDPLFLPAGRNATAAELDPREKNRISHRGIALASLLARLPDWLREEA